LLVYAAQERLQLQKAGILLLLTLTVTADQQAIQGMFYQY
jgi:hypothetical protein